jgi:hypothetical protein
MSGWSCRNFASSVSGESREAAGGGFDLNPLSDQAIS